MKEANEFLDLLARQIQQSEGDSQMLKRAVAERDVRVASLEAEVLTISQGEEKPPVAHSSVLLAARRAELLLRVVRLVATPDADCRCRLHSLLSLKTAKASLVTQLDTLQRSWVRTLQERGVTCDRCSRHAAAFRSH